MNRSHYYERMRQLARDVRTEYGLISPRVLRSDLRRIYKAENIRIDLWPHKLRSLRGAYFNDMVGASVLLARGLPEDPMIFTMGHELKHHLVDRGFQLSFCDKSNESEPIEIGAEVFAAELIYPEGDFSEHILAIGIGRNGCRPEDLVRLKRETRTTLSYAALAKRAEFLGFARPGLQGFSGWRKLEEQIYGVPLYKRLLERRRATAR